MTTRSGDHHWKVGGHARAVLDRARAVAEGGADLPGAPERLQESIRTQVATLERRQVEARLAEMPIEELRKLAPGLRLGSLLDAGYDTVAQVADAPNRRLLALPGVGKRTAHDVKDAAKTAAGKLEAKARFRFDADRRDDAQTRLLATLTAERHARGAAEALREPLAEYARRLAADMPTAERAAGRWRMRFTGRRRTAATMDALAALEALLDEPGTSDLERALADARRRADPDAYGRDELWRALEAEPAYYGTAIANLTGADVADFAAAEDYVGEDLRESVDAVKLDVGLLTGRLRTYQLFGAKFAVHQGKAILGDEMGLGKTVQALAACAHLAADGGRHFLVVCPASVQANWLAEARRHTLLKAYSLHGANREDEGAKWLREGGLAVTTFDTLHRLQCLERDGLYLAMLVVDEAHFIKNPETRRSLAILGVREHARATLFLTGTPMEHRVEEFRNLVSYLEPDLAESIDARETIAGAEAFRRVVAPVYLRRNQEDVLNELPERIEVQDWVRLSDIDEERYRSEVRSRNLMGMRRAASAVTDSGKLERLAELVEAAEEDGHKVVVFSYFLDVLESVQKQLGSLTTGAITGAVPSADRQDLVDRFTRADEPTVLLAQIEAGGVGLNIQAASVVIICEPQWRPSVEEQAIARAHRMGQARRVQVRRLLAKDCVDERICEVQENKLLLFEHFARRSETRQVSETAVNARLTRPLALDDESVPLKERVVAAERFRLGLD
jgi:superfamily II DNA or RNA helicase